MKISTLSEYAGEDAVIIDGYRVDPATVDMFYNMSTGRRVTDAQWDESKRRLEMAEAFDAEV